MIFFLLKLIKLRYLHKMITKKICKDEVDTLAVGYKGIT